MRYANKFKLENLNIKKPLGRHRCRWEDNVKTNLKEMEYGVNSVYLADT
jgi:hypothetical protein